MRASAVESVDMLRCLFSHLSETRAQIYTDMWRARSRCNMALWTSERETANITTEQLDEWLTERLSGVEWLAERLTERLSGVEWSG